MPILITAHSPVVVFLFSKSFNVVFSILAILISFKFLVTIIGEFFLEDKYKFCKYNVTESDLTIIFPSSDSPDTRKTPGFWITTAVSFLIIEPSSDIFISPLEKTIWLVIGLSFGSMHNSYS